MKAFITGVNGFTGSHLAKALCDRGHSVVGFVRPTSNLSRLQDCNIELVRGDLGDRKLLQTAMQEVDIVFHIAAYVELGLVDEEEMTRTNVEGTRSVLEAAKAAGVPKAVYCSTIGVFGDTGGKVIDETFQRTQTDFSSAYDRTKFAAQQLADEFANNGLSVVSVMPSGIFGADDPHFGPVLSNFLKGKLKVWAGGKRMTGIVHVDDLVEAMLLAAEKAESGEHFIISAGDLSTREMFEILGRESGMQPPQEIPEPVVRFVAGNLDILGRLLSWNPPLSNERVHYVYDRCVRVDSTKARQQLGWNPRSVEETLVEIARELRS